MYDYIKGVFTSKINTDKGIFVTIEAGGIGYLLLISARDYADIKLDTDGKLYTVLIHKEDRMSLCGFLKREERDIFNILTSVSGVGSKMALMLLNEFDSTDLIGFVLDGNFKALTRAKGVGAKLAQKIIIELKDKLMNYKSEKPIKINSNKHQDAQALNDAQMVLVSLGYENTEIESAISKATALKADSTAEEILKEALRVLSI
ncbi:MAG: Holliday junction branch migration protein RuvA [Clostridiaceae bacterium]|jgi:holliday junction DNA helicase RuvA|nr:Holliday junction branch migration protein RuvA [Clostridiaceae bacterium]